MRNIRLQFVSGVDCNRIFLIKKKEAFNGSFKAIGIQNSLL